jgi:predicted DNA binding CopG/RHH family protein
MKNNVRIYFRISSDFYEEIKKEAQGKGISVAQLCRQKLKTSDRMERMEFLLEKLSSSKK